MEIYAQSIRHFAVEKKYERLQSTVELESIFQACLNGQVETVRSGYEKLEHPEQVHFLPPLATLAVQKGQAEILKFCLENRVVTDHYLKWAVERNISVGIFEVLYAANWRKMQDSPRLVGQMARDLIKLGGGTGEALEWFLNHGASLRGNAVKEAAWYCEPSDTVLRRLLDMDFKAAVSPEALAYAASRGHTDIVKQMLDAGLEADTTPPLVDVVEAREGPPKTALFQAVTGSKQEVDLGDAHLETARLLLDHGARVDSSCGPDFETPMSAAHRLKKKNPAMIKLLQSYPNNVYEATPDSAPRKRRRL
jgi:hypothetical protein